MQGLATARQDSAVRSDFVKAKTSRSERGFALIAALGVLAALLTLVAAVNSSVTFNLMDIKRLRTERAERAVAEAGARQALSEKAPGPGEALQREYVFDGVGCSVRREAMQGAEDLYSQSGLVFRPGDARLEVRVGAPLRGTRAVWLANATPGAQRMILLERGPRGGL